MKIKDNMSKELKDLDIDRFITWWEKIKVLLSQ